MRLLTESHLLFLFSQPGDAGVAEEERALHRGGVSESVQHQENEGNQGAAQRWPGGGLEERASFSARRAAQSMFSYLFCVIASVT